MEMMIVDFEIKNQLIKQITEKPYIVNNNKKYVQLNFNFKTEDWNDINKYIIFKVKNKYDRKTKNYLQLMGYQNNVSVIVPSYAIKNNFLRIQNTRTRFATSVFCTLRKLF